MSAFRLSLLLPASALLLSACVSTPGPQVKGTGQCDASQLGWAIGQPANEPNIRRLSSESGAGLVNPIGPNSPPGTSATTACACTWTRTTSSPPPAASKRPAVFVVPSPRSALPKRRVGHGLTLQGSGFGIPRTIRQFLVRVEHPIAEAEQAGIAARRVLLGAQVLLLQRPLGQRILEA